MLTQEQTFLKQQDYFQKILKPIEDELTVSTKMQNQFIGYQRACLKANDLLANIGKDQDFPQKKTKWCTGEQTSFLRQV